MWTPIRFFLSLRAVFFSSSSNINAVAANRLLENKWCCIFDGNNRRPPITCCSGGWLNTTDSVNTDHSDGTKMERWRNGNVTHSVNRPYLRSTYVFEQINTLIKVSNGVLSLMSSRYYKKYYLLWGERLRQIIGSSIVSTVDPRVTTGLTYEQLGLRPKF